MFGRGIGYYHGPHSRRGFGLKYWILYIASKEELTGSDISSTIARFSEGGWFPSPGSLYITLKDLVDDGLLSMIEKDGRKYYKTTQKGVDLLNDSWFPWHRFIPFLSQSDTSSLIDNLDEDTNLLVQNIKVVSDQQKERIKQIIEKLKRLIG